MALISMERFRMVTYFYATSFSIKKRVFMKLTTFLISRIRLNFTKLLGVSKSSIKIKPMSHRTLFLILLISAVTSKQRFLHGNKIVQFLQKCKCYILGQDHFRKSLNKVLQGSWQGAIFKWPAQFSKAVQF